MMRRTITTLAAAVLLLALTTRVALAATYVGTNGPDNIMGSQSGDRIDGRGGDDRLFGRAGNNRIDGGPGADFIAAGSGNDVIINGMDGERGVVYCGPGKDTVRSMPLWMTGNDLLVDCESAPSPFAR